jgi:hypothetical protein
MTIMTRATARRRLGVLKGATVVGIMLATITLALWSGLMALGGTTSQDPAEKKAPADTSKQPASANTPDLPKRVDDLEHEMSKILGKLEEIINLQKGTATPTQPGASPSAKSASEKQPGKGTGSSVSKGTSDTKAKMVSRGTEPANQVQTILEKLDDILATLKGRHSITSASVASSLKSVADLTKDLSYSYKFGGKETPVASTSAELLIQLSQINTQLESSRNSSQALQVKHREFKDKLRDLVSRCDQKYDMWYRAKRDWSEAIRKGKTAAEIVDLDGKVKQSTQEKESLEKELRQRQQEMRDNIKSIGSHESDIGNLNRDKKLAELVLDLVRTSSEGGGLASAE